MNRRAHNGFVEIKHKTTRYICRVAAVASIRTKTPIDTDKMLKMQQHTVHSVSVARQWLTSAFRMHNLRGRWWQRCCRHKLILRELIVWAENYYILSLLLWMRQNNTFVTAPCADWARKVVPLISKCKHGMLLMSDLPFYRPYASDTYSNEFPISLASRNDSE